MISRNSYSVLHLHSEGAAAISYKPGSNGGVEPTFFYQSPKATGSLESALKQFFEESNKELLYINIVSETPTLQTFSDASLLKQPEAFAQVLEAHSEISAKECDTLLLEAEDGSPYSGKSPLVVNSIKSSEYLRAQSMATELGFDDFKLFNNSLSTIGALIEWRLENNSQETIAVLEIGQNSSIVNILGSDRQIGSKKISLSVQDIAECIQQHLQLKFESAALLLFYNGVFDFSQHLDAICKSFAQKLTPHLQNLGSKFDTKIDHLLISSLPTSYSWLNERIPAEAGFEGFTRDDFYFLQDISKLGDCGSNPGLIGMAFCAHADPESYPWLAPITKSSLEDAYHKVAGIEMSAPTAEINTPAETMGQHESPIQEEPDLTFEESPDTFGESFGESSLHANEAEDVFEEAKEEAITFESGELDSPVEIISFEEKQAEQAATPQPKPKSVVVTPIEEEEEKKKNVLGLVFGGLVALFLISGGALVYFQESNEPYAPVPIHNVQAAEVEDSSDPQGPELAQTVDEETPRTLTRTHTQEPKRKVEPIDLFETEGAETVTVDSIPAIPYASLLISSQPSGASVFVNGENKGTTPVTVGELQLGQYAVEFKLEGYVTKLLDVAVESAEVQVVKTDMELPAGILEVHTTPLGVNFDVVSTQGLDKVVFSGTTPATIPDLLTGPYEIQFKRGNWEDIYESAEIRFNETSLIDVVYPEGWLMVSSEPDNVRVFENGQLVGSTPLRLKGLKVGERRYTLRHPDYEDLQLSTQIESQTESRLHGSLLSWDREVEYDQLEIPPTQKKRGLGNTQRLIGNDAHRFLVEFVINKEGTPENIEVLETTYLRAHGRLIEDISKWTFEPGLRKGRAVKTRVRLPIILGDESKLPPVVELAKTEPEEE